MACMNLGSIGCNGTSQHCRVWGRRKIGKSPWYTPYMEPYVHEVNFMEGICGAL